MLPVLLHRASHPQQASAWELDGSDRKIASGLMADLERSASPEAYRVDHWVRAVGLSKIAMPSTVVLPIAVQVTKHRVDLGIKLLADAIFESL